MGSRGLFGSYAGFTHVMDGPTNGYTGTSLFTPLLYLHSSCNQLTISKATPFMYVK